MTGEEIPQQLLDIVDRRAGRKHSRDGVVASTLAEVLTAYRAMLDAERSERTR